MKTAIASSEHAGMSLEIWKTKQRIGFLIIVGSFHLHWHHTWGCSHRLDYLSCGIANNT